MRPGFKVPWELNPPSLAASLGAVLLGVYTPATGLCTSGFSTQALLVLPEGKPLP